MSSSRARGAARTAPRTTPTKDGGAPSTLGGAAGAQEPAGTEPAVVAIRAAYMSAPVGLGLVDTQLRYLHVNEALAAMNGVPVADHIGRTVRQVLPRMADVIEPLYREVIETGRPVLARELRGSRQTTPAADRHWLASYHPLPGPDGLVVGVSAVVQDITDRKRAEAQLTARARQQAVVAALGQSALATTDLQELADEVTAKLTEALEVDLAQVLELEPDGRSLLLRAGTGWRAGAVGRQRIDAGPSSQAGLTLAANEPVATPDIETDGRFARCTLLREHGAVSGLTVVIAGQPRP